MITPLLLKGEQNPAYALLSPHHYAKSRVIQTHASGGVSCL